MLPFHCRLQAHFEKVKRICDTTTLPLAMHHLSDKIMSELDISKLTDKLRQGKVDSSALTPKEKYDTWEEIKIKSMEFLILSIICYA
jgi:peroxin-3